jgi:hypothetical protein
MVFEHVKDAKMAWSNVYYLLASGGIGFAFVPTLYSPPFVINRYCPEWITSRLLRWIDPKRNDFEVPKFPAYYKWCRARENIITPLLLSVGFREATVLPFFGTPYFPGVPLLKGVTAAFDEWPPEGTGAYLRATRILSLSNKSCIRRMAARH